MPLTVRRIGNATWPVNNIGELGAGSLKPQSVLILVVISAYDHSLTGAGDSRC